MTPLMSRCQDKLRCLFAHTGVQNATPMLSPILKWNQHMLKMLKNKRNIKKKIRTSNFSIKADNHGH